LDAFCHFAWRNGENTLASVPIGRDEFYAIGDIASETPQNGGGFIRPPECFFVSPKGVFQTVKIWEYSRRNPPKVANSAGACSNWNFFWRNSAGKIPPDLEADTVSPPVLARPKRSKLFSLKGIPSSRTLKKDCAI